MSHLKAHCNGVVSTLRSVNRVAISDKMCFSENLPCDDLAKMASSPNSTNSQRHPAVENGQQSAQDARQRRSSRQLFDGKTSGVSRQIPASVLSGDVPVSSAISVSPSLAKVMDVEPRVSHTALDDNDYHHVLGKECDFENCCSETSFLHEGNMPSYEENRYSCRCSLCEEGFLPTDASGYKCSNRERCLQNEQQFMFGNSGSSTMEFCNGSIGAADDVFVNGSADFVSDYCV